MATIDAVDLLTDDHRDVEQLFSAYERTIDDRERSRIVHQVVHDLAVHGEIEELLFYPRLRTALQDGDRLADEAVEDHLHIKQTLNELDSMRSGDDGFDERMQTLMREVREHVREEEGDLFPRVRRALTPAELTDLGEALHGARSLVPTRPHPSAPTTPLGKLVAAPGVALVDRIRDLVRRAVEGRPAAPD